MYLAFIELLMVGMDHHHITDYLVSLLHSDQFHTWLSICGNLAHKKAGKDVNLGIVY